MRVISGRARGLKLIAPNDNEIRPTTDRVKESMFNIISDYVFESEVLDIFSGSGALGIECISRGAKKVYFCDKSKDSIRIIKDNIKKARFEEESIVLHDDYKKILNKLDASNSKFDLIFIDPPYYKGLFDDVINSIIEKSLLKEDGLIIVEHDANIKLNEYKNLNKYKEKKYGMVMLTIYTLEEKYE